MTRFPRPLPPDPAHFWFWLGLVCGSIASGTVFLFR